MAVRTHLDYLKQIAAGVDDPRALAQEAIEEGVAIDQLKLLGGEKAGPRKVYQFCFEECKAAVVEIEAPPDASLHDIAKMAVPQLVTLLMARSTEVMHR